MNPLQIINSIYPAGRKVSGILLTHSEAVAREALEIARRKNLGLDPDTVYAAAMLHDIGIIRTDAPGIGCYGSRPYLAHGPVGADMLRALGVDEIYARVAERHTGVGLLPEEIAAQNIPLPPDRSYMPETVLEKLICYADCYYSKGSDMSRKSRERVLRSLARFGPAVTDRFLALEKEFG